MELTPEELTQLTQYHVAYIQIQRALTPAEAGAFAAIAEGWLTLLGKQYLEGRTGGLHKGQVRMTDQWVRAQAQTLGLVLTAPSLCPAA